MPVAINVMLLSIQPMKIGRKYSNSILILICALVKKSRNKCKNKKADQSFLFHPYLAGKQEVRAYITNKVAKGEKLPAWADRITSMKDGRLSIKPKSPRTDARKKAAKRPHNPRMGPTKRKHGGY